MKREKRVILPVTSVLIISTLSIAFGAGIIISRNTLYNPNHAVSTENPLIPMAITLEYDQNYYFTLDENETHYYKFWANTSTYILIELQGSPLNVYVSMYYNPVIMFGGGDLIQKDIMIRKTTRIIRNGWVYFYVGHTIKSKNSSQSYSLRLEFTPNTGQINDYLYI
ncbi:MAG: hypothetical protein ACTSWY_12930 [Promethearchaeota archaeon]